MLVSLAVGIYAIKSNFSHFGNSLHFERRSQMFAKTNFDFKTQKTESDLEKKIKMSLN